MSDRFQQIRFLEAILFASAQPLGARDLAGHLPEGADLDGLLEELGSLYANRGVTLARVGERWAFRTAPDLAPRMEVRSEVTRKLSRAAVETLAIIAYHQPVTRAEIEEIRGVTLSRGTLDTLLEAGWIKPKGRRRTPGRPVTWGTSGDFLDHFGLESLDALPGLAELKAAGLLDSRPAIAALGAKGRLAGLAEAMDSDGEAEAAEVPLAADFGEDLPIPESDSQAIGQDPDEGQGETAAVPREAVGNGPLALPGADGKA